MAKRKSFISNKIIKCDMRKAFGKAGELCELISSKCVEMSNKGLFPRRVHLNENEWKAIDKLGYMNGMVIVPTDLVPYAMIEARTYMNEVKFEEVER